MRVFMMKEAQGRFEEGVEAHAQACSLNPRIPNWRGA
jgi:hypothetical protein